MILNTDIPTRAQVDRLIAARGPGSVSIYLATDPDDILGGEPVAAILRYASP